MSIKTVPTATAAMVISGTMPVIIAGIAIDAQLLLGLFIVAVLGIILNVLYVIRNSRQEFIRIILLRIVFNLVCAIAAAFITPLFLIEMEMTNSWILAITFASVTLSGAIVDNSFANIPRFFNTLVDNMSNISSSIVDSIRSWRNNNG